MVQRLRRSHVMRNEERYDTCRPKSQRAFFLAEGACQLKGFLPARARALAASMRQHAGPHPQPLFDIGSQAECEGGENVALYIGCCSQDFCLGVNIGQA
jgi:hypothetical protein